MSETRRPSIVITGASSGIGRACALFLSQRGFRVFAGVRKREDGERLEAAAPGQLSALSIDVTDAGSIESAVKQVSLEAGDGGLAGLVNNAGIVVFAPLELVDLADFRRQIEVNVIGHLAVTQAFLPLLRRGRGRIVNMGSVMGFVSPPCLGAYASSKHALESITDTLRRELQPWGIAVSIVQPAAISTPIWRKAVAYTGRGDARVPAEARALYEPLQRSAIEVTNGSAARGGDPDLVAETVWRALTAKRPRTRYRVGRTAQLMRAYALVGPDRMLDWSIRWLLGSARRS
jgi:NAD(P)-dependent dehydrogenase (short-subunit alcohol dehydrogenase family)